MKLILWLLVPATAGALGLHYGLGQKHVGLENSERLFNSKMHASLDAISSLGHDLKGHSTPIATTHRPMVANVSSTFDERVQTIAKLADYALRIQTPCSSGTG